MVYPEVLDQLVENGRAGMASWYATPLSVAQARAGLQETRQALRGARAPRQRPFSARLAEIIFRYWAGLDVEANYRISLALLDNDRDLALLELCYGQLLMARRQASAWEHLDAGFTAASRLLEPEDYFIVLKRHELLRLLPPLPLASPPASLDALLTEARVIARLGRPGARPDIYPLKHTDITG